MTSHDAYTLLCVGVGCLLTLTTLGVVHVWSLWLKEREK